MSKIPCGFTGHCLTPSLRLLHWHNLHGYIAYLRKKTIQHRAAQQNIPTRADGLAEDYVGNVFLLRKTDERI